MATNYSLHDRLTMQQTHTLNVGDIIEIDKVDAIISYVDSKTKQQRQTVVVQATDGMNYYLPNTIGAAYIEMVNDGHEAEARAELEHKIFRCEEFIAKAFGTKGKTLAYVRDSEPIPFE